MTGSYIETTRDYALAHLDRKPAYTTGTGEHFYIIEEGEEIPEDAKFYIPLLFDVDEANEYLDLKKQLEEASEKLDNLRMKFMQDADAFTALYGRKYAIDFFNTVFYVKEANTLSIKDEGALNGVDVPDLTVTAPPKVSIGKTWKSAICCMLTEEHDGKTSETVLKEICNYNGVDPSISKELSKKLGKSADKRLATFREVLGISQSAAQDADYRYMRGKAFDECQRMADCCGLTVSELEEVLRKSITVNKSQSMSTTAGVTL